MFAKNYGKRQRQLAFKSYNQKWKEQKDELQRARLVRESWSVVRVGSEMWARNPPVLRAATLRQRRPCGRELGPHRATQGSSDHTVPYKQDLPIDGSPRVPHVVGRMPHGVR